jgi:6-hydroxymethylpterin diphosphokinase MptE-like protein/methyltransferase family protein
MAGAPPSLAVTPANPEALKYRRMWEQPAYRHVAPGEQLAATFLQQARPPAGAHVLDFGAGTGRGALMLAILGRCRVTMLDFVTNALDPEIQQALTTQADVLAFVQHDLEQPIPQKARYGYCTDVMEHIPPAQVKRVLTHILLAAQHVFFGIALGEDSCGALIGEPLHLTVRAAAWWLATLADVGFVVHWSEITADRLLVYGSAWMTGREVSEKGILNTEETQIRANVTHNLQQGWMPAVPHPTNDIEVMILGGGPTLGAFEAEIHAKRAAGVKLITLNGAYNWALAHGLTPSLQIIADAREFNKRFTKPVVAACRYLIGSQCDPAVFEGLPKDRTFIWHMNPTLVQDLLSTYLPDGWYCVPGGSTVLLRALPLMRMLGFRRFHLYGCDSCLMDAADGTVAHHAFPQPENNGGLIIPVMVNAPTATNRVFRCAPWMVSQAEEFLELIRALGDVFELEIHGDGLLAYLLTTAAALDVGAAIPPPSVD